MNLKPLPLHPKPTPKTSLSTTKPTRLCLRSTANISAENSITSSSEEIIETLSSEDTQATEAPAITAATTTVPPEEIDWGGIVDDGFVLGGGWGDHLGQGGGGYVDDGDYEAMIAA